ncbi:acetylgalactosaminyl-O-glycosyl-glycoprotein beta-1,3-N-acetylglucosaminyltransferase-like isoform X1 [Paramormyrops kingsleyae]|uniref:acetylgalactosaminyl-O-glycosyl-glycoprotein beta-1,3-N-acetylglucosaminyltransferase-like isoform X2 n=1 Tax=Paramormyrops kingsleyae TaxID=1676925 RepID=UPI003B973E85
MAAQLKKAPSLPRRLLYTMFFLSTSALLLVLFYNDGLTGEWQSSLHQAFLLSRQVKTYPLLHGPRICPSRRPITLLLAVKSHISNFEQRQAIRNTWGKDRLQSEQVVRRVFLLSIPDKGVGPYATALNSMVMEENNLYRDILQWDFQESFYNVTLKELLFWHWFQDHCMGSIRYVLKGDDDVFVDVERVLDFLRGPPTHVEPLYMGRLFVNTFPVRLWWNKYYVPWSLYSGAYPPYMGGGGYLISNKTIRLLLQASSEVLLFPIDDVYVGMCAEVANISARHHQGFMPIEFDPSQHPCIYWGVLVLHRLESNQQYLLWDFYKSQGHKCDNFTSQLGL